MIETENLGLAAQRAFSATIGRGAVAVAVAGGNLQSGSSEMARAIAEAGANFGRRMLLVRAVPVEETAGDFGIGVECLRARATQLRDRLFLAEVPSGTELHSVLNDSRRLAAIFADWSHEYDGIILDCPAYGDPSPVIYTPMAAAAVDAVLLVTTSGTMPKAKFESLKQWLAESGAQLSAIIINDRFNPTLAQEVVREARRLKRLAPWLPGLVARQTGRFPALNRLR